MSQTTQLPSSKKSPLLTLISVMAKGFLRDRMTVFWSIAFPLMFLVLFGGIFADQGAAKVDLVQVGSVAVLDDAPPEARKAIAKGLAIEKSDDLNAATKQLSDGDIDGVLTQDGTTLRLRFSAADQVKSAQVRGWIDGIVQTANQVASQTEPMFTLTAEQVEDDSLQQIQYITPSLLGWAVAMSASFGAALNLVAWRVSGLLRRMRLAPVPTSSVMLAHVGVSVVVALVQAAIFIGLGVGLFGLKLTGWWPLIIPLLIVGTLAFLSIGMLGGAVSKTEEAAVGLTNFVILPMAFLSGSFFPLDGAPRWLQFVSNLLPLTHLNQGMLDVMVRGQGPSALVMPVIILLAFAAVFAAIGAKLFRWDS